LDNCLPLLSIGQCIQFLSENGNHPRMEWNGRQWDGCLSITHPANELIDALWQAVEAVL
jgi:hypothetical protein